LKCYLKPVANITMLLMPRVQSLSLAVSLSPDLNSAKNIMAASGVKVQLPDTA